MIVLRVEEHQLSDLYNPSSAHAIHERVNLLANRIFQILKLDSGSLPIFEGRNSFLTSKL